MDARNGDNFPVHYDGPTGALESYGRYRYPSVAQAEEGADVSRILGTLRDKVWWVAAAMVVGGALGFMYSRNAPLTYRTKASLWIDRANGTAGAILPGDPLQGQGWMGLLLSNAVLAPVARDFDLHLSRISPPGPQDILVGLQVQDDLVPGRYEIRVTGQDQYRLLDEEGSVVEEGTLSGGVGQSRGFLWYPDEAALRALPTPLVFSVRFPHEAAQNLAGRLNARYEPIAQMIYTEFRSQNPERGVAIHNAIIDRFLSVASDLTIAQLDEEVRLLEQQAATTQARLQSAERELSQFMVETITEPGAAQLAGPGPMSGTGLTGSATGSGPAYTNYFQQQAELDQIEADISELDSILEKADGGKINLLSLRLVPSVVAQPTIQTTISQAETAQMELNTLLYTYTTEHPLVTEKNQLIRDLHTQQLPALIRELQANLRSRAELLRSQVSTRAGQLEAIPERTIQEARLSRARDLAEQLHTSLLGRLNSARLAADTRPSPVRLLDAAVLPRMPESETTPPFFILIGALVGLGLAVGVVIVHDRLDGRIRHPEDISGKFGLPLLGVVPQLKEGNPEGTAAVAIESFRSIRTQLAHAYGEGDGGPVLITSSTPREGKSVVAANLAISYASSGMRTLLVDADIRRGRLHSVFSLPRSPGLTEHLMGDAAIDEVIRHDEATGLDVLCSGALSANAELIGGSKLDAFLATVRDRYDVVVLDGPPLAAGADALILGQRCDKVVMVFRAGTTSEGMARTRLSMLGNVELPIVGAVLNAVPEHAPYYQQYVNYYYYAEAEAS